jgi:hypothetical protein
MHIVGNLLSLSLSQISSRSSDGQHSQLCHSREQQQEQHHPASTTNTRASVDHARPDAANDATNYGEQVASSRTTTSAAASVA